MRNRLRVVARNLHRSAHCCRHKVHMRLNNYKNRRTIVDAKLFEAVDSEVLETEDVQNANGAMLEFLVDNTVDAIDQHREPSDARTVSWRESADKYASIHAKRLLPIANQMDGN